LRTLDQHPLSDLDLARAIGICTQATAATTRAIADRHMSMQSEIIPSGRGHTRNPAGRAVIATTAMLVMLVLLGLDLSLVALIALCVLGSILIMTDRSIKHEPIAMLV
jgi:ribose/xylose/arabinose/galactoside ABC-type transport system permease subunit